jgi:hypothetical protein
LSTEMRLSRRMQPTFQRRAPVPCHCDRRARIAPACGGPCVFTTPGPASPTGRAVVWALSSHSKARPADSGAPVAVRTRPREKPRASDPERPRLLPPQPREGPRLGQPGAPAVSEQPFSGRSPIQRLCRRRPVPGNLSPAAVTRFGLGRRPPARPRPSETSFDQFHSLTFATSGKYGHTRERPNPAPKRARERLISLRSCELPRRAPQAARANEALAPLASRGRRRADQSRRVSIRTEAERPARRTLSTPWSPQRRPSRSGEPWVERRSRGHRPLPTPRRVGGFEWPGCLPLP